MKVLPKILVLCCLAYGPQVWSACSEAIAPGLPNPDFAGEAEMLRAQVEVKHYIVLQQGFLNCVQHNARRHNQAIDRMHEVANKYNSTARRYKARMQSMNMITDLALLSL